MTVALENDPPPLARDTNDAIRVGGNRVSLDSVLHLVCQGATAEEIATSVTSRAFR